VLNGKEEEDNYEEKFEYDTEEKAGAPRPAVEEEEDMLDIAESCFIRIAQLMLSQSLTIRKVFN